jgi:hypothetical protein
MSEVKPIYVTLDQAKLLKEKGFNEVCDGHLVVRTGGVGKGEQYMRRGCFKIFRLTYRFSTN